MIMQILTLTLRKRTQRRSPTIFNQFLIKAHGRKRTTCKIETLGGKDLKHTNKRGEILYRYILSHRAVSLNISPLLCIKTLSLTLPLKQVSRSI